MSELVANTKFGELKTHIRLVRPHSPTENNLTHGHGCCAGIYCGNMQWPISL